MRLLFTNKILAAWLLLQLYYALYFDAALLQECLLTFSESNSSEDAQSKTCLVRDNNLDAQQVNGIPCDEISSSSLVARWYLFPDGTIRGTNGFCLTYVPGTQSTAYEASPPHLEARPCENRDNFPNEHWSTVNQRLINHYHDTFISNTTQLPFWIKSKFEPQKIPKTPGAHSQIQLEKIQQISPQLRFTQLKRHLPNETQDSPKYEAYLNVSQQQYQKVDSLINDINRIIDNIKRDVQLQPSHVGQGVVVEIMETPVSIPSATLLSPHFHVSPELLSDIPISSSGPLTVRASAYLLAPKDALYTFVVTDLGSQFKLTVNGETVINQWAAPMFGFVKSSPPLSAKQGDEFHIVTTTSTVLGSPTFKLLWLMDSSETPEEIPSEALFPSLLRPLCSTSLVRNIQCTTPFSKIQSGGNPRRFQCPAGCLSRHREALQVFGAPGCYALQSSICAAAIHSGIISERGGSILVELDAEKEQLHYPGSINGLYHMLLNFTDLYLLNVWTTQLEYLLLLGVPGFLIESRDAPASIGCASIAMPITDGGPIGLTSLNSVRMEDFLNAEFVVQKKLSGQVAMPSGAEISLVSRRKHGEEFLTDLQLKCDSSTTRLTDEENLSASHEQLSLFPGVDLLYSISKKENLQQVVANMFLTTNPQSLKPLAPSYGWNRLTCQTLNSTISLFFQSRNLSDEVPYSSMTISCKTSFRNLKSPLPSFVVRCPRFCTKTNFPVYGYHTYSENSSVCRSAIHAGILADAGGNVLVNRLPIISSVTWGTTSNGIASQEDKEEGGLFHVDRPFGVSCIYPEHPGGIVRVPLSSSQVESSDSFRQQFSQNSMPKQFLNQDKSDSENLRFQETTNSSEDAKNPIGSLEEYETIEISPELHEMANHLQNTSIQLENYRQAVNTIESLIKEKIKETESQILELENEVTSGHIEFPPDFYEYDKSNQIEENFLIIDAKDAAMGPSDWKLHGISNESPWKTLRQSSSISSNSNYGTFLLYRHNTYDAGFITARVKMEDQGHGTFGFVVKFKNDNDFIGLEISKPHHGGASTVAIHRMKEGNFSIRQNVLSYNFPTSTWIRLAADFGRDSVRFFINDGEVKTGLTLEEPNRDGFVGFFTRGLGSESNLMWDSIVCGPLWSQSVHHLEKAFGNDNERTEEISIPDNAIEVDPVYSVILAEDSLSLNGSKSDSAHNTSNALLPQVEGYNVPDNKEIQIKKDITGCLLRYSDPLSTLSPQAWITPGTSSDDESSEALWSLDSEYLEGKATDRKAASYMILNQLICKRSSFTEVTLFLKLTSNTKAGLLLRNQALNNYYSAYLDLSDENGANVGLDEISNGKTEHYDTGSYQDLEPNVWYKLGIHDFGSTIRIFLNDALIMQVHSLNDNPGSFGLIVLKGLASFRSFDIVQHKTTESDAIPPAA